MLTTHLIHVLALHERAGIDRREAADMIGVSPGTFDKLVRSGVMPRPIKIGRRKVWSRSEVEAAFSRLSGATSGREASSWDEVLYS